MRGLALFTLALFAAVPSFAADTESIKSLVGRYPVLEWNNDPRAAGVIEIINDNRGIGFTLQPLGLASHPVAAASVLAPASSTVLTRQGTTLIQESTIGDTKLHIEYQQFAGYLDITSVYCPKAWPRCETTHVGATSGKASGERVDFKTFASQVQGSYVIDLVGGKKPNELDKIADVSVDTDEADFTMPYCPPGTSSCDPGYLAFNWSKTEVFHRTIAPKDEIYSIFYRDGAKLSYFSWENNNGAITFRNFQYRFKSGAAIALEHTMHKN